LRGLVGPKREVKPRREFFLREIQLLPKRAHTRHMSSTCKLDFSRGEPESFAILLRSLRRSHEGR
jgi:hypothetical protein